LPRVLLLLPADGYRNADFLAAAAQLEVEIVSASDYCHRLAPQWGFAPIQAVPFDQPEAALEPLLAALGRRPDAVLAVDDSGQALAALARARLGLSGPTFEAVQRLRDKLAFRRLLRAEGLLCPAFRHLADPGMPHAPPAFPVVVKARRLSASRAVLRADDAREYRAALARVAAIQRRADRDAAALGLIVESFIPGFEVALEGLLEAGRLRRLALFDKPDPLDGPAFEETLYVTPSRLAPQQQDAIARTVERACAAAGLAEGPIHAEARVNAHGVWLLEIAPRSIGGLCGRVLRHALGMSLEALILRHALGRPLPEVRHDRASGVMMIPVPRRGILRDVAGVERARQVAGIDDVQITARAGQLLMPPPEGASYLGFVFARGAIPQAVENSLRRAHAMLDIDLQPEHALEPAALPSS